MNLAVITVTYNPDIAILATQLSQLGPASLRIVVDNGSASPDRERLADLCEAHGAVFIANAENLGLASAINIGAHMALEMKPGLAYLLLLDQDTEPGLGGVEALVNAYETLLEQGYSPGCVGPRMVDAATGLQHGFHCMTRWRWWRRFPPVTQTEPVLLANLNGSGTLIPADIYRQLGDLDGALFIDHVDTEWSFRLLAAGYVLYGIPTIGFVHRMGEASVRYWLFGWRVWPSRSPRRHYFLFRNAVILMWRNYVPGVWKVWAAAKLLVTFAVHALFDVRRKEQSRAMLRGLREGLAGRAAL